MKTAKRVALSPERIFQYGLTAAYLLSIGTACVPQPGQEALKTPTPDQNALNAKRQRGIDALGQEGAKYLGDPLSSFTVDIPAQADGSKPASTVSGTIFEVKTEMDTALQASHLTLGLFVPENGDPTPVLINHISNDPDSLIMTQIEEDNGLKTERYGIAAMPLDGQYLDAFLRGDVEVNGPIDQFLKKNALGETVPLYTILFNDITPNNVQAFVEELAQLQDPAKIQEAVLSRIFGVTFSDLATDHSVVIKLDSNNQTNIKDFIANLFFGSDMVAQAKGLSDEELTAQASTATGTAPTKTPTTIPPTATALPPTETPVVRVELDQPMTTKFDLLNTEVMPSTNEGMVRSGDLNKAVRQYWQETGLINPDGSINKPENVVPALPELWRILHFDGDPTQNIPGGDLMLGPFNSGTEMLDGAFQPTDLLFKVKNSEGVVTGVLVTEALYYIDPSGNVAIEPVFFFVDISKTSNPLHPKLFGHEKFENGHIILLWPYIGIQDGEEGNKFNISRFIEDKNAFLSEPMQEDREAFAQRVDETGNPKGMGDFWWSGIATSGPRSE